MSTIQRFVILAFLVGALLCGLTVQAASVAVFAQMNITDNRLLADTVNTSSLLGVGAAVVFFAAVVRNHQAVKFSGEVIGELAKVHWPSREEALRATTTVVFATLFMAALIGVYDFVWKNVADVFLFTEG